MTLTQRNYTSESDKLLMTALVHRHPQENLHVCELSYRLSSWALDDMENGQLWFDEQGELAAWAVLQSPFWTIDYACAPALETELHLQILAWAEDRAGALKGSGYARPSWFLNVFSRQAGRIRDMESMGFKCQSDVGEDSWAKVLMHRSRPEPVKMYDPPAGFTVRPLNGEKEVAAYVELQQAVFQSKNMTQEWRTRTLAIPGYRPELDLVVECPDGRLGAFCICWFNETTATGRVEPLGCHQDFRAYALGRVALSHGLRRLQSMRAKDIYVETDSYRNTAFRLYESFDFEVIEDVLVFRKDFEE